MNILVAFNSKILPNGILETETMKWFVFGYNPKETLKAMIQIDPLMIPTIFGFQCVSPLDVNTNFVTLHKFMPMQFFWTPVKRSNLQIHFSDGDKVIEALLLYKYCIGETVAKCNSKDKELQKIAPTIAPSATVMTFLFIVNNIVSKKWLQFSRESIDKLRDLIWNDSRNCITML
jgi:hypothetical protein